MRTAFARLPVICTGSCEEAAWSSNLYSLARAALAVNVVIIVTSSDSVLETVRLVKSQLAPPNNVNGAAVGTETIGMINKNWLAFLDDFRTFCLSAENQVTVNLIDLDQLFNSPVPMRQNYIISLS